MGNPVCVFVDFLQTCHSHNKSQGVTIKIYRGLISNEVISKTFMQTFEVPVLFLYSVLNLQTLPVEEDEFSFHCKSSWKKNKKYRNIYTSVSDPSHFDVDPDPDPGIHIW